VIRQFGDVAAVEFNGESVEQWVIGLDAKGQWADGG
jgi:hypothetical protein